MTDNIMAFPVSGESTMTDKPTGAEIIAALQEATKGDLSRVTVLGTTWLREDVISKAAWDVIVERNLSRILRDIENVYEAPEASERPGIGSILSFIYAAWSPYRESRPYLARADLVRAAALIVAEIERLDRAATAGSEKQEGGNV